MASEITGLKTRHYVDGNSAGLIVLFRCLVLFAGGFGFLLLAVLSSADKADSTSRFSSGEEPGNFFHRRQASQTLILVERAFANRKMNLPLDTKIAAEDIRFAFPKAFDDVAAGARLAQGIVAGRSSSFHSYGDHSFLSLRSAMHFEL